MSQPYTDERLAKKIWIRTFDPAVTESEEYVWHRDTATRVVTVIEGLGWQFQLDNELPKSINKGNELVIPRLVYHRLLKGATPLKIKIEEVV